MKKQISILLLTSFIIGCAISPDRNEMIYVGSIDRECSSIFNNDSIISIPIDFKVMPLKAAESLPNGCKVKFSYSIYADTENYYFVDNGRVFFGPKDSKTMKKNAFIINGKTGKLVATP